MQKFIMPFGESQVLPVGKWAGIMGRMGSLNQNFLLANCVWGAVASGYMFYGWKQRSLIPFLGGLAMMAVSCLTPALTMTAASIAIMLAVWWLLRQGY
jgi:hypothetical protein